MSYARNVVSQTIRAKLHEKGLFYERKYETGVRAGLYESKVDFASPAQMILDRVAPDTTVIDVGSSDGHVASVLRERGCRVIGVDLYQPESLTGFDEFIQWDLDEGTPKVDEEVNVVVLADIIEHLRSPEDFAADLADFCVSHNTSQVLVSTGNVAFAVQRVMLALGQFNYGPRGILDMTHTRLFTAGSITRLFKQAGFRVRSIKGVPAPFPLAVGRNWLGRTLLRLNQLAIRLSKRLFSYQLFLELEPPTNLAHLLEKSAEHSERLHSKTMRPTAVTKR
jgi:2-polyprenyl-3-methyl-5-hydroxy-6-metoxy-1,4-benzoquinol methylase